MTIARESEKLTTLEAWASAKYGDHAPTIQTLRRWCREGRIWPRPKRHGRRYFLPISAREIVGPLRPFQPNPGRAPRKLPPYVCAKLAERNQFIKLSRIHRCPPWANRRALETFYQIARRVSDCTGVPFEVDHVIPLRGLLVNGLHVESNLRVIPARANRSKGRRFVCS